MEISFYQLSGSSFFFVKNTHQKAVYLLFHLILQVAKEPWLFLEVQFSFGAYSQRLRTGFATVCA
jgi:hypothetical protein